MVLLIDLASPVLQSAGACQASVPVCRHLRRKAVLPLEESVIWRIEAGFVRTVTWDEEGNVTTLGIWGPGDLLTVNTSKISLVQVECLTNATFRLMESARLSPEFMQHRAECTDELLYLLQVRCTRTRL